ncbi:exported protein of unknown function [Candidatus Saccharimonas aalborgensis]|jgi:hypothetical protein|uniref:Uncharacterized protein n=1 Tax=Candidatus Saccharimonas aalborgensis TaxID=1332188 RepID=R4PN45_9BACT|nr:hypothetical protein [Candidatus Saccharimonas aalborgensis]AGL62354.1 exported protein of unknown function [Candidatus Saccharimonas aalborgensis]MBP7775065.1 hypothetical protein [Candidatus Saccharimonas sp.]QQS71141.1 MAG: hypothetical protein IPP92_02530 [Candidatus Saccharibacteria bacterium]
MKTTQPGFAKSTVVLLTSVIALLGLFGLSAVMGYSYIGFKTPQQKPSFGGTVCTKADIDGYIALQKKAQDVVAQKAMLSTIETKKDYKTDATCVFMAVQTAIRINDLAKAKELYTTLKSLNDNGQYVNGSVPDLAGNEQTANLIKLLENPSTKRPVGEG